MAEARDMTELEAELVELLDRCQSCFRQQMTGHIGIESAFLMRQQIQDLFDLRGITWQCRVQARERTSKT